MAVPSIPVRTCVGCRRRAPVTELLRVVVLGGGLTPDPRRRLPGRGASLHPTAECLQAAERRRALPRALRCSTSLETGLLAEHLARHQQAAQHTDVPHTDVPNTDGPAPGRSARREQDVLG